MAKAKSVKILLTLTEQEREYLREAYKRYVSMEPGEILTMNKWLLNKVIEAIDNEAE